MNRRWTLAVVVVLLVLSWIWFYTDWFSPEPIQIAYQIRPSIQPPRFTVNRPKKVQIVGQSGQPMPTPTGVEVKEFAKAVDRVIAAQNGTNAAFKIQPKPMNRVVVPVLEPAPGGVANVTFSLDAAYLIKSIVVWDTPTNGAKARVVWQLTGRSTSPERSIIYGRIVQGMQSLLGNAEPLVPGAPYRLEVKAGRHHGDIVFTTTATPESEEETPTLQ